MILEVTKLPEESIIGIDEGPLTADVLERLHGRQPLGTHQVLSNGGRAARHAGVAMHDHSGSWLRESLRNEIGNGRPVLAQRLRRAIEHRHKQTLEGVLAGLCHPHSLVWPRALRPHASDAHILREAFAKSDDVCDSAGRQGLPILRCLHRTKPETWPDLVEVVWARGVHGELKKRDAVSTN